MFSNIRFTYFIRRDNGSVIAAGCEQEGSEHIYFFDIDGSVKTKDDDGFWHELSQDYARRIRFLAARFSSSVSRLSFPH
jgi:hypothetical protein